MARFYQTAERNYIEDGIYKPPVELALQVIAKKDAEINRAIEEAELIKDEATTNIRYWAEADSEIAKRLFEEYDAMTNGITQAIVDNPLSYDSKRDIAKARGTIKRDMRQNGRIYNLNANLNAYENAVKAFGAIADKDYGNAQLRHYVNEHLKERAGKDLTEHNYFNYSKYGNPTENIDMVKWLSDVIRERESHETTETWFNTKNGIKTKKTTDILTEEDIEMLANKYISNNIPPEALAKMKTDDTIKWNGDDKWLMVDKDGNVVVNTEGRLWKDLVDQVKKTYYKNNVETDKSIFNEDLFLKANGLKTDDEEPVVNRMGGFVTDSSIDRQVMLRTYTDYLKAGGKPLEVQGFSFNIEDGNLTVNNKNTSLAAKIAENHIQKNIWRVFGKVYENVVKDPSSKYTVTLKTEDGKTVGKKSLPEMFNSNLSSFKATGAEEEKAKANFKDGFKFTFADAGTDSYEIGNRKQYDNKSLIGISMSELEKQGVYVPNSKKMCTVKSVEVGDVYSRQASLDEKANPTSVGNKLSIIIKLSDGSKLEYTIDMLSDKHTHGNNAQVVNGQLNTNFVNLVE